MIGITDVPLINGEHSALVPIVAAATAASPHNVVGVDTLGLKPMVVLVTEDDLERQSLLGDRLTCSKARNRSSDGYSLTQPMRGPAPVVHLQDNCFPNWYDFASL